METTSIPEREEAIINEFMLFDDWMGKYEYLIELGKDLPLIEEEYKTDNFRIRGCQSQVWLRPDRASGHVVYRADSDAMITKGLIALLIRVLSDQPPQAVAEADVKFLEEIGLKEHLSSTRKNGLQSMVQQMKAYANALAQNEQTA
ncbi:MAG: SufE family protein [Bacteroidetes bacterium]|jgi:cysteine desulfuration protein SufE|nr:SufE family protein [Bacteroidota bacterium]